MIKQLKLIFALFFAIGVVGLAASPAASAFTLFGDVCENNADATVCQDKDDTNSVNKVLALIVNILAIVIGVAAVIVLIIAGIQYMMSTGDPTKVNNAKNAILYAVIGLALAVFARIIVVFVINKL